MTPINTDQTRFDWFTEKVGNAPGYGFAEKVYQNSMVVDLRSAGLRVEQQVPITVCYEGVVVGEYIADRVVEGVVLVELKAAKAIDDAHRAQCINYLVATGLPVCLVINFGRKVEIKRIAGPSLSASSSV